MALDTFNPYLFVSAGEQSNKFLTPTYADGIARFQAQRAQELTGLTVRIDPIQEGNGDPAPDNIRPISGRTGLTVTVQSGDTQNTYPISWQTEAGTVYGGTLDAVSGVLTVNRFCKAFDGTEDWARTGSIGANTNRYYIQWGNMGITGNVINLSDSMCSHLVFLSGNAGQFGTFNASTTNFAVKDGDGTQFADMAAFKAWLAAQNTNGTPLQLCVELATPQTCQLSPTDVQTLAGFNQIYSDAGPVIDIKF